MKKDNLSIGNRIKWARKTLGLQAQQAANLCGVPVSTYWQWENGASCTDPKMYLKIAQVLNKHWQGKVETYKGTPIKQISTLWVMFGQDRSFDIFDEVINIIDEDIKARERELQDRIDDLEKIVKQLRGRHDRIRKEET